MIPKTHPRYKSLKIREKIVTGYRRGAVVLEGLIAHGRGEAFDYILGEKTSTPAKKAIKAAAALLLLSRKPVLSVNGNVAALTPREIVKLSEEVKADIEVNLFYRRRSRLKIIGDILHKYGAKRVLGVDKNMLTAIPELHSERRKVDKRGIWAADTVFVPLEDGDRTEALIKMGKNVIAVDLNPLSRTAQNATITIVDNIVRALPLLIKYVRKLKHLSRNELKAIVDSYDNNKVLAEMLNLINRRFRKLTKTAMKS